ncbi:uncharacterized protein LOC129747426 [Uranotaenia lowii]|uniref:uncharacterized protein LOC129747426 n=1 Tax=Uranotaenia lowii TaxID=190385 RepID=UPI00247A8607|nr:uncharacterized protein LOC129747426 [Uranotaenia lowii]
MNNATPSSADRRNSNNDSLTVITPDKWPELRDIFKRDWPEHLVAYHTIDNFIDWHRRDPQIKNLTFYSLNGEWQKDGTYLIVDRYQLFLYTLATTNDVLERALNLLNWNHGFKISCFLERHRSAAISIIEAKGLRKEYDSCTVLYYLPCKQALELKNTIPDGFTLKELGQEDAIKADAVWPNKHRGSLFFLQRLAAWNVNTGLYDENGELIAWSFRLQSGALGALQVDERHLKRGYGTMVAIDMAHRLAHMNQDCFAFVNSGNIPSKRMFEKLGFLQIDTAYWLRTYPTEPFEWSDSCE